MTARGGDGPPTRLSFAEALAAVVAAAEPLPAESVPLMDALGRALADDVASPLDLPPWDNAAMDGYAVRVADVHGASRERPATLRVVGDIAAGGDASAVSLGAGDAARISTGAPVPASADAVVRVEDTEADGARVRVLSDRDVVGDRPQRRNVRPRGEDVRAGATVLERGTTIGAAAIGVLASVGRASVPVTRRPRVAIVSSGDELARVDAFDAVLAGRRIVSSNSYALTAHAWAAGADATDCGFVRDDAGALRSLLATVLARGFDAIVTSGGVSVGLHDHTRDALLALGAELRFWRVRMRPGGPFGFGVVHWGDRRVPWLGLPGNPVSALVTFELFGRPLLRRMGGHRRAFRRAVSVRVGEPVRVGATLTHFLRVTLDHDDDGHLVARLTGPQGSNLLTSMARAEALLVVPEGVQDVPAGATLHAILLGDDALDAERPPA
ncbi:MoeA domain protein domain I and II [Gemmatirosa kalamazoonensis]|uniref:Molybdopterin molybdenumtransferase n=1 Tax=Gemmatirosa kalamazoonensis TaxID=861299 RepID=W0RK37_9BACT|nr:gephyrin-like molybdotransferase Glp [Gemmatirosa kalamazoonensis]AHG91464.1 MoeA domain protein domain I and II [Gemmatirosa kalamazoonensis]